MDSKLSELVFILDRSGSMAGLEEDTIGGYNALLARQKEEPGEALVTTVLFDDHYEVLHDRLPLRDVLPVTRKEYFVRGSTALLDAVGRTLHRIGEAHKYAAPGACPEKTLVAITTDGMENASREYDYARVRMMVERQKEKYGWEFLFLGANMDAIAQAERFGIHADRAANYRPDKAGTRAQYDSISRMTSDLRAGRINKEEWKRGLDDEQK